MDFDADEREGEIISLLIQQDSGIRRMFTSDNPIFVMARAGAAGDNFNATAMARALGRTYDERVSAYLRREGLESVEQSSMTSKESYETLLRRLYDLPVILPPSLPVDGFDLPFLNFNEATQKLQQSEIEQWTIDPLLQPWAGPSGSPNRVITLFGKDGRTWLVRARFDERTNQIFPAEA